MKPIEELPNNGVSVLLMRRTGAKNVKTCVGCRDAYGVLRGWFAARPPTHWIPIPPYAKGGE